VGGVCCVGWCCGKLLSMTVHHMVVWLPHDGGVVVHT